MNKLNSQIENHNSFHTVFQLNFRTCHRRQITLGKPLDEEIEVNICFHNSKIESFREKKTKLNLCFATSEK